MNNKLKLEWICLIAESIKTIEYINTMCSAPFCENEPAYVCIGNYIYFLCNDCRELVLFEKRYAAFERKTL